MVQPSCMAAVVSAGMRARELRARQGTAVELEIDHCQTHHIHSSADLARLEAVDVQRPEPHENERSRHQHEYRALEKLRAEVTSSPAELGEP